MTDCNQLVSYYRKFPGHHVEELWNKLMKKGAKSDQLRDILLFYMYNYLYPTPQQKYFDSLLLIFASKGTSKKTKIVVFQIIEETCMFLESSIAETVCFSSNFSSIIELLNCILIGGMIPLLDETAVEKLLRLLKEESINDQERGKLAYFICQAVSSYPSLLSVNQVASLCQDINKWLQIDHSASAVSPTQSNLRTQNLNAFEVDGTPAGGLQTILTLDNSVDTNRSMRLYAFSLIRELAECHILLHHHLAEAVFTHCDILSEQCFRTAAKEHDVLLQKSVLCEVLDLLSQLVHSDKQWGPKALVIVKRINSYVTERFKGQHSDVSILIRALSFLLNIGETMGYNSYHISEQLFGDAVYHSYSSDIAAMDIMLFIWKNQNKLATLEQNMLKKYFPNLLKIIASHPHLVIEEFLEIIPTFVAPATVVELLHSLLDLPVLAASLLLHQVPAVLPTEQSSNSCWASLVVDVRSAAFRSTFSYLLRQQSQKGQLPGRLGAYIDLLGELATQSLVITCSQIVPLLLDKFFSALMLQGDADAAADVLCALLTRLTLLFKVPGYTDSVHKCLWHQVKYIFKEFPKLVLLKHSELSDYISILNNRSICPEVYTHLVWAIGEYTSAEQCGDLCKLDVILKYYETLECVLYEILMSLNSEPNMDLKLLNITCSSLAKLSSRSEDLIPRALLSLSKVKTNIAVSLLKSSSEKQIVIQRVEELTSLLNQPSIARAVLSASHDGSQAMSAAVRVLAQFME
ncbi:AP-5 complex subunit zeta-1-like isoform X1 [Schistocerca serialis cubense]|uniref:AP-5 complex subunit zeta-1-like isoform X1 n=1 Tax=Schistocerca serialis cubense TaxID=2023355 RepID=UPI00214E59C2|nr:AP-5 complex subunit zeta-1-like isoform X1 [Schistocerca serialis cubense]